MGAGTAVMSSEMSTSLPMQSGGGSAGGMRHLRRAPRSAAPCRGRTGSATAAMGGAADGGCAAGRGARGDEGDDAGEAGVRSLVGLQPVTAAAAAAAVRPARSMRRSTRLRSQRSQLRY